MADYYCNNCEWEGNVLQGNGHDCECPECGGSWEYTDAISSSDYEKENPREVPNE